jgi:hypothetical protein
MQSTVVYDHAPGQANSALLEAYGPVVRNYYELVDFIRGMAERDLGIAAKHVKRK